jgi:pyrroloquinoline quinone (PQQ) biosynthesis protein C
MSFYDELQARTTSGRDYLLEAPIIGHALRGAATLEEYVAFLCQAYHHVKHTVPLLMATGARLPETLEWLRVAVAEYIEEEIGHQEWILNDIAACGFDKEKARRSTPNFATKVMVGFAYDTVQRGNPVGFFGMVQVLEGTSIQMADRVADSVQNSLRLPDQAFTYLRSHGALDQDHVRFFRDLVNRFDNPSQQIVLRSADIFYRLYGDMFRSLSPEQARPLAIQSRQQENCNANTR